MKSNTNDNILSLISNSPDNIIQGIATRVRERRLELNLTQKSFASKTGIALPTYRRFESTGEISLRGLALIALTLEKTEELNQLFSSPVYKSLEELAGIYQNKKRKRGRNE